MKKTPQKTKAKKTLAVKKPTKFKWNYIVIPLITFVTAYSGSLITSSGMEWYSLINKPSWTPPGYVIGMVWTAIFILATISALRVWNKKYSKAERYNHILWLMFLFIVNAILNVEWSFLFFGMHTLNLATFEAGLLGVSVLALIITIWPVSKLSSLLLVPYLGWVSFATYLTYLVYTMN